MSATPFHSQRHEIETCMRSGVPLALAPLPAEHAERLGALFAAMDPWASYPYPASALAGYFARLEPGAPRFALYAGDEIAGVAGLRLEWLRGPYVQFLGILGAFQGRGYGHDVLRWIEDEARRARERNLWVLASEFNTRAVRFYEREGFARVATLDALVSDRHGEVLLRKRL